MTITAATWGMCYLLHFSRALGNLENARAQAQHYLGWAEDTGDGRGLEQRIAEHMAGRGARITRAAVAQGIELTLVATWVAPLGFEKILKRRKEAPKLCGLCCRARGQRRKRAAVPAVQLVLPFDDAAEELPAIELGKADWYEVVTLQRWRAARGGRLTGASLDDEGLL